MVMVPNDLQGFDLQAICKICKAWLRCCPGPVAAPLPMLQGLARRCCFCIDPHQEGRWLSTRSRRPEPPLLAVK